MWWAKEQSQHVLRSYIGRVYEPFWKRELDIEDPSVIVSMLRNAGAEVSGFLDYLHGAGRRLHDTTQAAIFDAGIFGVPSYVIDGELFFGREHLPMVRWLLSGRVGRAPDIAYGAGVATATSTSSTRTMANQP